MLLRASLMLRHPYRDKKVADCYKLLLSKKTVEYDHIAIDMTGLVGNAMRVSRGNEQRRLKEVSRFVAQAIHQLLRRFTCRRSLLLAMDGAESLTKAHLTRAAPLSRRMESRLARLPGTVLMQSVEEKLLHLMPPSAPFPAEVVLSGTRAPGSAEEKMASWALDVACRHAPSSHTGGAEVGVQESMCLVGSNELYLVALGLTPFAAVTSAVVHNSDIKTVTVPHLVEWLGGQHFASARRARVVAAMRTDCLFLLLLSHGCSGASLPSLPDIRLVSLLDAYHRVVLQPLEKADPRHDGDAAFLFRDAPGHTLTVNLPLLAQVLAAARPASSVALSAGGVGVFHRHVEAHLELVLQCHSQLCLGAAPDPFFLPTTFLSRGATAPINLPDLHMHVVHLSRQDSPRILRRRPQPAAAPAETKVAGEVPSSASLASSTSAPSETSTDTKSAPMRLPLWCPNQPLTAAEFTLLSLSAPLSFETAALPFTGGVALLPDVAKRICALDTAAALTAVRRLLALSGSATEHPHSCLYLAPSYVWLRSANSQTSRMLYIDLGTRATETEVRRLYSEAFAAAAAASGSASATPSAEEAGAAGSAAAGQAARETGDDDPVAFSASSGSWEAVRQSAGSLSLPTTTAAAAASASADTSAEERARRREFKALTWNVMFDRYSNQPTPLGMPGIDWCSPRRYPVLAALLAREDADVVAMQEVEPAFLEHLAAQPWCRERYVLSCGPASAALSPWGVVLLVRRRAGLALEAIQHVNIPAWSGHTSLMPVATLRLASPASPATTLHVASVHLLAPFTRGSETARATQDAVLRQKVGRPLAGNALLVGDFNSWPGNDFTMPPESRYVDCWPLVRPGDLGKTMDDTNTFCKLKIEEMYFGRSDKMFLRSSSIRPVEAHLVGTRSVNAENGNTDAPDYLFPSDHYGVSMTFAY